MSALSFLLGASFSTGSLIQLLIWVAIACVVIWAIIALIKWSGIVVPQPVIILFWAFLAIALIILMARFFRLMI